MYINVGKHSTDMEYFSNALNFYKLSKDSLGLADTYNAYGATYRDKSDYQSANENFIKSLNIFNNLNAKSKQVMVLNNISMIHIRQRDYTSASVYTKKALDVLKQLPEDSVRMIDVFNTLGLIYNDLGIYDSTVYFHNQSVETARKYNKKLSEAIAMQNIANAHRKHGKYELALSTAQKALQIKEALNNKKSILFTKLLIADIYCNWNKPELGIEIAKEALKVAGENGFIDRKRVALLYLSQCYDSLKDYQTAYLYHKSYTSLQDSIFDASKAKQIDELQTQYETAQKEQYIASQQAQLIEQQLKSEEQRSNVIILVVAILALIIILFFIYRAYSLQRANNKLLNEKNREIETRDREKEILLKEIHHRVKNNLQIISSILNIQSRKLDDDNAKKAVSEGRSRIKSMSLIHEKLYSNNELSVINMREYVSDLSEYLFKTYDTSGKIKQAINVEELELDIDTAIPIGLILNELISNALKYAFEPENEGQLNISLKQSENNYQLSVADSGKGLPENYQEAKSMGLKLVNSLTKQLDGLLDVKNESGSVFTITFTPKQSLS